MKKKMILQALEMFYIDNLTQKQIGEQMGISRSTVVRLLAEGRKLNYIEINIREPERKYILLEKELKKRFALKEAYIVATGWSEEATKRNIAQMCAEVLMRKITSGMCLSVSGGSTLHQMTTFLRPVPSKNVEVVSMHGNLLEKGSLNNPVDVAADFAHALDADWYYCNAPAVVDTRELRDMILESSSFRRSREKITGSSIAVISAGGLTGNHSTMIRALFEDGAALIDEAKKNGACGEVLGYYIDTRGALVDCVLNRRIVSIELVDLKSINTVILIGGGEDKVPVLNAILAEGYSEVFISDSDSAEMILEIT